MKYVLFIHMFIKSNEKIVFRNYHNNILTFKKDNYKILLDFNFYILFFLNNLYIYIYIYIYILYVY